MLNIREKVAADNPAFNDSQAMSFVVTSLFMSRPHLDSNSLSIFPSLAAAARLLLVREAEERSRCLLR